MLPLVTEGIQRIDYTVGEPITFRLTSTGCLCQLAKGFFVG